MKRKFAILLSAMLLMQAVCGCGGAASSGTSSASASTGSIAAGIYTRKRHNAACKRNLRRFER